MRPDRVTSSLNAYIRSRFGDRYVDARPFKIEKTNSECTKNNPIFFVLFPGVDPTDEVTESAGKTGRTDANGKFVFISMG